MEEYGLAWARSSSRTCFGTDGTEGMDLRDALDWDIFSDDFELDVSALFNPREDANALIEEPTDVADATKDYESIALPPQDARTFGAKLAARGPCGPHARQSAPG